MLEGLEREQVEQTVHRCGNLRHVSALAKSEGLTLEQIAETIAFMREGVLADLMRGPFVEKPLLNPPREYGWPTRFSNGDWPVYYGALDESVALAEVSFHFRNSAREDEGDRRPRHYSVVRCTFSGQAINLVARSGQLGWEGLTSDAYTFCQALGAEAQTTALDGFLTPSARADGANLPVFVATTLSRPEIGGTIRLLYDAALDEVRVERVAD